MISGRYCLDKSGFYFQILCNDWSVVGSVLVYTCSKPDSCKSVKTERLPFENELNSVVL